MRIIGLTGVARSGKDTVGELIEEIAPELATQPTVKRTGFAHLLKLSATRLFYPDATLEQALEWCDWLKTKGLISVMADDEVLGIDVEQTGRDFLQRYGTEAHRDTFSEDFWLDAVLPEGRDDCDILVITDCRFENEAQRIQDRGGEVWQLVRPGVEAVNAHVSDAGFNPALIDRTIENDGSLTLLRNKVEGALLHDDR